MARIEWRRWARPVAWCTIALLLGVAVYLLVSGIAGAAQSSGLDERGVEVPADVLDVSVDAGGEGGPTSEVTVRFKVLGDEPRFVRTTLLYSGDFRDDHPDATREGVRVEYDAADPDVVRIVGESGDSVDRIVAGAVFLVVIPVIALVLWRRPDVLGFPAS